MPGKLAIAHHDGAPTHRRQRIAAQVAPLIRCVVAAAVQDARAENHLLARIEDDQVRVEPGLNRTLPVQLEDARRVATGEGREALETDLAAGDALAEEERQQRLRPWTARRHGV